MFSLQVGRGKFLGIFGRDTRKTVADNMKLVSAQHYKHQNANRDLVREAQRDPKANVIVWDENYNQTLYRLDSLNLSEVRMGRRVTPKENGKDRVEGFIVYVDSGKDA